MTEILLLLVGMGLGSSPFIAQKMNEWAWIPLTGDRPIDPLSSPGEVEWREHDCSLVLNPSEAHRGLDWAVQLPDEGPRLIRGTTFKIEGKRPAFVMTYVMRQSPPRASEATIVPIPPLLAAAKK